MTALTSSERQGVLGVPGVYGIPRVRVAAAPRARTDVAGFIGFETRLRNSRARLLSRRPDGRHAGHEFVADVPPLTVTVGPRRLRIPARTLRLSPDAPLDPSTAASPIASGQAVRFSVIVADHANSPLLLAVPGAAAPVHREAGPTPAQISEHIRLRIGAPAGAPLPAWTRLADVSIRRLGDALRSTIIPAQRIVRCDEWRDYVLQLGPAPEDGTLLSRHVHAFFACGGARCYLSLIGRPEFDDAGALAASLREMLGLSGASQEEATGLERLLLVDEVSIVDAPDLYARRGEPVERTISLPAAEPDACFHACSRVLGPAGAATARGPTILSDPLFDDIFPLQRALLERCITERWRVMLLLAPPLARSDEGGVAPPSPRDADAWRNRLHAIAPDIGEPNEVAVGALFFPWLRVQEHADAPIRQLPPTGLAAGVMARRDLARGPHVAPANETITTCLALTCPIDDATHAALYEPDRDGAGRERPSINVFRAAPGYGVQLWGSRTMSTDRWFRYIPIRRGLSAIQRRCKAALEPLAFEPNTTTLWLQAAQIVADVLLPLFQSGGLRGERSEDAFEVRCDESVNPPESVALGRLVCEIRVALAAPAEYIVFRVGRSEGIVEVLE